ncbi:hypothetical protein RRV45_11625 [Bacillus sp. DTU_2020_1000418_1_SI_GHA_SEK_038]|uniref:hypothetical protein n=1 Tax=Bacillus sp. DTU_2020_1000418_1_SI_GHA_SEK_038 TaxID=3077585 RepID=UPI0028E948DD|nr:hypothetical protein [Bacillus sp. DTU_2020_1000418_1_SI_GHA_SEK_038]WNS73573.1 hypothetical protein RRV45_11625 [Bacillus sp. DTU_2020_1000418_1_SI_GHA_SEK_038]
MEKRIEQLGVLAEFQHCQVILNFYDEDDFLWKREGFHFDTIDVTDDHLIFSRKNDINYTIYLQEYPNYFINRAFQHYYTLRNQSCKLDIYFPH